MLTLSLFNLLCDKTIRLEVILNDKKKYLLLQLLSRLSNGDVFNSINTHLRVNVQHWPCRAYTCTRYKVLAAPLIHIYANHNISLG